MANFNPRAGAIRAKDSHGDWIMVNPGHEFYSTITLVATERWDVDTQSWLPIWEEDIENGDLQS